MDARAVVESQGTPHTAKRTEVPREEVHLVAKVEEDDDAFREQPQYL